MVRRAQTVSITVTVDMKALWYLDEYAQKNRLSRSGAIGDLMRLARAYLQVLDTKEVKDGDIELEKPSILLEKDQSIVGHLDEWLEKQKLGKVEEYKPQKMPKKAKTPKG